MAFHHVALTTRDTAANHRFYSEAMGFDLVKVNVGKTPGGGWARHLFYDTGGDGLIAFWEIHDDAAVRPDWQTDISRGLGLPPWANHVAFEARSEAEFDAARRRWLEHGHDVAEVDHGFCRSLYTSDPSGITVEWCITTAPFTDADREHARRTLTDPSPELGPEATVVVHRAGRADG